MTEQKRKQDPYKAIVIGIVPIPGQAFYATPIVASILAIVFLFAKRK